MDIGRPLVDYGPVDIAELAAAVATLPQSFWESDSDSRTRLAPGRPGSAVFYYNDQPPFVRRPTATEIPSGAVNVLRSPNRPLFAEVATAIATSITPHFPLCAPIRVQFAALPPGRQITPHRDSGILTLVHRLHVPVVTNPGVTFSVRDRSFHFEAGRLYDLNNTVRHSVRNDGDRMRVHLMVDMLPRSVAGVAYHDTEAAMAAATR